MSNWDSREWATSPTSSSFERMAPVQAQHVLDSQLSDLLSKEQEGGELPLALRRFAARLGHGLATEAMRVAVQHLLNSYSAAMDSPVAAVSVDRLCKLAGAQVLIPPRLAIRRNAYSLGAPRLSRSHTGAIVFSAGRPRITISPSIDKATARVSVAHELGHLLIHRESDSWDSATIRLPVTPDEEALAEYAARLLLMPTCSWNTSKARTSNLAEFAVRVASTSGVTVHASATRLGDPDVADASVRGVILWRLNPRVDRNEHVARRMTPQWHLCPEAFVPIGKCGAKLGSLVAKVAGDSGCASDIQHEEVRIGSFTGIFLAHGFAWGSVEEGTRVVLTVYQVPAVDPLTRSGKRDHRSQARSRSSIALNSADR